MFEKRRKDSAKRRIPPQKLHPIDVMEHRFWLVMTGIKVEDLDGYTERFKRTFEKGKSE